MPIQTDSDSYTTHIQTLYNKKAQMYNKLTTHWWYYKNRQELVQWLLHDRSKETRILDLGCGTGLITEALLFRFPKSNITAYDYSEGMIKVYEQKYPGVETVMGNFNDPAAASNEARETLKPGSFDLVISSGALSEYGDPNVAIPYVYSLLKEGGTLINFGIKRNLMGAMIGRAWDFKPLSLKAFMAGCYRAGFASVEVPKTPLKFRSRRMVEYMVRAMK